MKKKNNAFFMLISLALVFCVSQRVEAQKSKKANKKAAIYECGYVHKVTMREKLNPMKLIHKGMSSALSDSNNPDLGKTAISVFYQAHQFPQDIIKYPTKTPGWETCGDAVYAGFTNKSGIGFSSTDGQFVVDGNVLEGAGYGTYYYGFSPDQRGEKTVKITSSNGNTAEVKVKPAASLEIISIDGKAKGEDVIIDGTKDIVIVLANGDADPNSKLHVQLICKLTGTRVIYDVIVTNAKNTIYIPKEAFKNFEGSPSPFASDNTLIVNRVVEEVIKGTDAGAIRTISAYMDWRPVTVAGDIAKGSIVTAGFDESKNTNIEIDLRTTGEYNFIVDKGQPFTSPPVKLMKNVAFASFVVRGNLFDDSTHVDVDTKVEYAPYGKLFYDPTTGKAYDRKKTTTTTTTYMKKWFPELSVETWRKLADLMYNNLASSLASEFGMNITPLNKVVNSDAYRHAKPIEDNVTKTFVDVGAGGTKRILTSSSVDYFKDLSITFGADFVSERLVKELGVDAVLAITLDLNFNITTEGIDPVVSIVAFAPNVSYKTSAKYFSMTASTNSKSLKDRIDKPSSEEVAIYTMIKGDKFIAEFTNAMKQLSAAEDKYPAYEKLWKAKL